MPGIYEHLRIEKDIGDGDKDGFLGSLDCLIHLVRLLGFAYEGLFCAFGTNLLLWQKKTVSVQ